jgi:hypothetical protein
MNEGGKKKKSKEEKWKQNRPNKKKRVAESKVELFVKLARSQSGGVIGLFRQCGSSWHAYVAQLFTLHGVLLTVRQMSLAPPTAVQRHTLHTALSLICTTSAVLFSERYIHSVLLVKAIPLYDLAVKDEIEKQQKQHSSCRP